MASEARPRGDVGRAWRRRAPTSASVSSMQHHVGVALAVMLGDVRLPRRSEARQLTCGSGRRARTGGCRRARCPPRAPGTRSRRRRLGAQRPRQLRSGDDLRIDRTRSSAPRGVPRRRPSRSADPRRAACGRRARRRGAGAAELILQRAPRPARRVKSACGRPALETPRRAAAAPAARRAATGAVGADGDRDGQRARPRRAGRAEIRWSIEQRRRGAARGRPRVASDERGRRATTRNGPAGERRRARAPSPPAVRNESVERRRAARSRALGRRRRHLLRAGSRRPAPATIRATHSSGLRIRRCASAGTAIAFTSSGSTKSRPRSAASARASLSRARLPRGEAPSATRGSRPGGLDEVDDVALDRRRPRTRPRARACMARSSARARCTGTVRGVGAPLRGGAGQDLALVVGGRDSRRRRASGSGRAAPPAADRCPPARSGSGWR